MPLVFGGAPVVNTFITVGQQMLAGKTLTINPLFYAGLILVMVGAVTVLVFSPKPSKPPAGSSAKATREPAAEPQAS